MNIIIAGAGELGRHPAAVPAAQNHEITLIDYQAGLFVAATLNNIGPGLDLVGPTRNYLWFTPPTETLLCLLVALGRLELHAFLVLLMPAFWQEE